MKLTDCINYLLTVSQHEVFQRFLTRLSEFGVTPGQYGALNVLWQSDTGTATPTEIARILRLETSTVSSVLDKMQKQGLILRVLDEYDRRSIRVQPTEHGWAIKDDVLRTIEELNQEFSASFTTEEWNEFIFFLKKIGKVEDIDV